MGVDPYVGIALLSGIVLRAGKQLCSKSLALSGFLYADAVEGAVGLII